MAWAAPAPLPGGVFVQVVMLGVPRSLSFKPHEAGLCLGSPDGARSRVTPRDPHLQCQRSGAGVSVLDIWEMLVSMGTACGSAGFGGGGTWMVVGAWWGRA